jgi:hypothetical protein
MWGTLMDSTSVTPQVYDHLKHLTVHLHTAPTTVLLRSSFYVQTSSNFLPVYGLVIVRYGAVLFVKCTVYSVTVMGWLL